MNKIILYLMVFVMSVSLASASLSLSTSSDDFENTGTISINVNGPSDAQTLVEISSQKGFYLPIGLPDLSDSSFDVVLEPDIYTIKAVSTYNGEELFTQETLDLSQKVVALPQEESTSNKVHEVAFLVTEFNDTPISDATIIILGNTTNTTYTTNSSGEVNYSSQSTSLKLRIEKDDFQSKKKTIHVDEDETFTFILLPINEAEESQEDDKNNEQIEEEVETNLVVTLNDFEKNFYASSYVPVLFSVEGKSPRCQVLTRDAGKSGYSIAQNVLSPKSFNEVVLTKLSEGEYDIRIRCIVDVDEAVVSQTKRISIINMAEDIALLNEFTKSSQEVLDKINTFPTSFKQVFIDEIISLEDALSSAKELSKKLQTDADILQIRKEIKLLTSTDSSSTLASVVVDSSEHIITYGSIDDVEVVIEYLDLSKSPKLLLAEQDQFAIKTNYNFVTLTYVSGLIKKQTFISNQIIPIEGTAIDVSFDEYFIMPAFLSSRLEQSNDVLTKEYDDNMLVRLLENSSALIFEGWLDDTTLIKTVVLSDGETLQNKVTASVIQDISLPEWQIPLIAFFVLILVVGLLFNPYYSALNIFSKDYLKEFVSGVHSCIDASQEKNHYKVIELVPSILLIHEKLSGTQKTQVQDIFAQLEELFYESSFHLSYTKITSKPAHLWSFEELEVAIKDFYASYGELSASKQQLYLPYFNQMIAHSQNLVTQVKK